MQKVKHTDGPWEVREHSEALWVYPVAGCGMGWVGDSYLSVCLGSENGAEANARLIAAAPDLLEAVWALVEHFERVDGDERHKAVIAQATAALAKANGEPA